MNRSVYLAASCVFLLGSGFASLVYQITWIRLLGQSLGSTSIAISTVLAVFFLGLALGSLAAERLTRSGRRVDFGTYAALELCIGLSALLLLPALLNLDALLALVPALGSELALKFALAALLFIVPTMCMGATFPLMATLLARSSLPLGRLLSYLYAVNTLGAVLGAFASGFLLIPRIGLDGAIHAAAGVNLAVAAGALLLRGRIRLTQASEQATEPAPPPATGAGSGSPPVRWAAGLTLFATGFASIAVQVGWTKYLAIFTGSTLYGLSSIVTLFLAGLALGSWAVSLVIDRVRAPSMLVACGLPVLGLALLFAHAGLGQLPQLQLILNSLPPEASRDAVLRFVAVGLLILPPTLILGALFPVTLRLYCGDLHGVRNRVGEAYAINTVAGIGGSLVAGFVVIPWFGTDLLLQAMTAIVLLLTLVWLPAPALNRWWRAGLAGLAAITFLVNIVPGRLDYPELIASVGYDQRSASGERPELLFLREGQSGIVSLVSFDGVTATLQNNGLNESQINRTDRRRVLVTETLLGLVPVLLHPAPTSAFVLGFGGGITTELLTQTGLDTIRVVELEPAVVEAVRQIPEGPALALDDPRVSLVFNDARNSLLVDGARYDLIVSQPSHPWLSGSANVFTEQFWQIAHSRLNAGGIFSQWVNLFQMDATTLRAILSAFYGVFEHGFALTNASSGDLVLIGSPDPLLLAAATVNARLAAPPLADRAEAIGLRGINDLLWYFGLSRPQMLAMAAGQPANSDTNILSEVRLAGLRGSPDPAEDPYALIAANADFDMLSLFGDAAESTMAGFAGALLRAGELASADSVIARLEQVAPGRARALRHRRLLLSADYGPAFALFDAETDWNAASRRREAKALMRLGEWDRARAALGGADRELAAAIELLATGNAGPALSLLRAPVLDLARTLTTLDAPPVAALAGLRALLGVPRTNTDVSTDQLARLLVATSNREAQLLADVQIAALSAGDNLLAMRAGEVLARLDPDFE